MPAASTSQALMDLFKLAQRIPVGEQKKVTVIKLVEALGKSRSDKAFVRKVQHQLWRLWKLYPDDLQYDEGSPQGWWWKGGSPIGLEFLTEDVAIAVALVMRYMQQLLPSSTLEALDPLVKRSSQVLKQVDKSWGDKLLIKRPGPARKPPVINRLVQLTVYDALKSGNELLDINYKSRADKKPERRRVWPHGLLMKDDFLYLVASKMEDGSGQSSSSRWYAMHRIRSVRPISAKAGDICPDFSLSTKDSVGWFCNAGTESPAPTIELVLRVDAVVAVNLIESPLQGMVGDPELLPDGWKRINARVQYTKDLETWLRSYGPHAIVEAPEDLRAQMLADASAMVRAYSGGESMATHDVANPP